MTIDYAHARELMVEQQIRPWDVLDIKVLDVLARLPREAFVADAHRALAYADVELPIGHGQKMMKPVIEGRTLQALDLQPGDEVLEIGTGSGFLSAFFILVGTHGLHVTFGIIWLVTLMIQVGQKGLIQANKRRLMCLSLFWHFLDVIWIGVFTFVYLFGMLR